MQLALGEAGFEIEQPGHRVDGALGVDQRLAENHVAAAFAVDPSRFGEAPQTVQETPRLRKAPRMQFRIAARKPAHVAIVGRRFIRERRKEEKLGAAIAPSLREMRVKKRESVVTRDGDALRGGRNLNPPLDGEGRIAKQCGVG